MMKTSQALLRQLRNDERSLKRLLDRTRAEIEIADEEKRKADLKWIEKCKSNAEYIDGLDRETIERLLLSGDISIHEYSNADADYENPSGATSA